MSWTVVVVKVFGMYEIGKWLEAESTGLTQLSGHGIFKELSKAKLCASVRVASVAVSA